MTSAEACEFTETVKLELEIPDEDKATSRAEEEEGK